MVVVQTPPLPLGTICSDKLPPAQQGWPRPAPLARTGRSPYVERGATDCAWLEGAIAMAECEAERLALREKMARLRALRLARGAAAAKMDHSARLGHMGALCQGC